MTIHSQLYMLFDKPPTSIITFLEYLAQAYDLPNSLDFLDVGCGPGRILQPCADLGWQVTGLEPDTHYCTEAQQHHIQSTSITIQQGGFDDISAQQSFDFIAAVNAPFGYLLTPAARQNALERIFRALKPGGIVFLDVFNFLWILRYFRAPQPSIVTTDDGAIIRRVIHHDIDWHDSTFTHTDTFYRNDEHLSTQAHRMAIITPREMTCGLEEAGFREIRTYNNYAARRHQRINKDRIMVSAQKPI